MTEIDRYLIQWKHGWDGEASCVFVRMLEDRDKFLREDGVGGVNTVTWAPLAQRFSRDAAYKFIAGLPNPNDWQLKLDTCGWQSADDSGMLYGGVMRVFV